ncbi:hypothetical protein SARC_01261 [Sphaeroforma arctica JP610]|uniref:Uncharacterized protein n=1 Tax=Sphaeroforma arctica JP610 TaxID=667725 RepID=A0A0L0GC69_9EUKA|nr:hypothetical protein SARC_01261 [Sphaeroforma arctica JP610]KNC86580.1 hypothetical protein SARC_01261 [Sphaeroforma arctica JP610]|eukprot:XP_014160482.1 hypothetical protein SARC_01261 [Sphaeroforma arctica JP610]
MRDDKKEIFGDPSVNIHYRGVDSSSLLGQVARDDSATELVTPASERSSVAGNEQGTDGMDLQIQDTHHTGVLGTSGTCFCPVILRSCIFSLGRGTLYKRHWTAVFGFLMFESKAGALDMVALVLSGAMSQHAQASQKAAADKNRKYWKKRINFAGLAVPGTLAYILVAPLVARLKAAWHATVAPSSLSNVKNALNLAYEHLARAKKFGEWRVPMTASSASITSHRSADSPVEFV